MLPEPLHPAVVHFPIVLVVLLPVFIAAALWSIRRSRAPARAWALPLGIAALLVASSFVAVRTGEAEEERVESVIAESVLHEHEEAGERFLVLSGVLLVVAAAGLARGTIGTSARLVTAIGSLGLVLAGYQVGAAGGELVYEHNAASVYADGQPPAHQPGEREDEREER